jgi:hypothetical protein
MNFNSYEFFLSMNNQGEFTVEELKEQNKGHPMSAENVWDKEMQSKRAVANATPGFVKILKFKVLRPLVAAGEKPSAGEFDVELEVDSGGSEDKELFKLLLKVRKSLDSTNIVVVIGRTLYLYASK